MENQEFDQLARESVGAPTRRTLVRGLAAVLGVSGLALALGDESEAGKKQNKRSQKRQSDKRKDERKKKEKKREEKREEKKAECGLDGKVCTASTNPCQSVACEKHKCVTSNVANGTACGADLVCASGACVCPGGICTVRVNASNLSSWVWYDDKPGFEKIDNSLLGFRQGPGNPPFGSGSVQLVSPAGERYNLATYQFAGTRLSDISSLKFTTYAPTAGNTGDPTLSGYLHFNVDFDGSDIWQRRLVFVPANNGTVTRDTWQEWDAINGGTAKWLWSNFNAPWPGGGSQPNGSVPKTWAQLISQYPGIRIRVTDAFFGIRDGDSFNKENTEDINSVTLGTQSGTTRFVFGSGS